MLRRYALLLLLLSLALSGCAAVVQILRGDLANGPNSNQQHGGDPTPQPQPSYYYRALAAAPRFPANLGRIRCIARCRPYIQT